MKRFKALAAFLTVISALSAATLVQAANGKLTKTETERKAERPELRLATGEDKTVDLDFDIASHDAIAIGNPQILLHTLVKIGDKRQIVFKPLKAGNTTVSVRDVEGTVRVIFDVRISASNLLRVKGELFDLLKDIEGIDIRVVGQKVIVDGEVLVPADYGRLLSVVTDKAYSDVVMNLTVLSPLAIQLLAKRIDEEVKIFAPNVKARAVNGMVFLEGAVDNAGQKSRASEVAKLYLPDMIPGSQLEKDPAVRRIPGRDLVQNFIVINPAPPKKTEKLVRVTVHFVELSKDYNKVFGFKWQPGFTSNPSISFGTEQTGGLGAEGGVSFTGTISSLFPKLASAQQAGYARILRTGTVIVRSGQPANLEANDEFTFTSQGANGQLQSQKQPVGLALAVTPSILGQSDDIQMDLDMKQSTISGRTAAGNVPTVAQHNVKTKLYVKSQESAAVAGVTASDVGTDFNKDDPNPGAFEGGTDPLFSILRSKGYRKKKSQFVIFVTPQIIESASEGTEDLKKNFRVKAN